MSISKPGYSISLNFIGLSTKLPGIFLEKSQDSEIR